MERSSSPGARVLAAAALICAVLVLIIIVAATLGGGGGAGSSGAGGHRSKVGAKSNGGSEKKQAPKVYVVESGDTLTSIAHETGVPVARIQELNPEVDPQVLVSGEKLKLR
jgi:LysM repeat protein